MIINKDWGKRVHCGTRTLVEQLLYFNPCLRTITVIRLTPHANTWGSDPNFFLILLLLNNQSALRSAYLPPHQASTAADKGHLHACQDIFWRENDDIAKCISHLPGNNKIIGRIGLWETISVRAITDRLLPARCSSNIVSDDNFISQIRGRLWKLKDIISLLCLTDQMCCV